MDASVSVQRVWSRISRRIIGFVASISPANHSIIIAIVPIMNPFIHLSDYRVIVCTGPQCKYAVLPIHVDSHLSDVRHNYKKEQQEQVIKEISQIEGLIQDTRGLESFVFPKSTSPAIPKLNAPKTDRLKCQLCEYVICHRRLIQEHCRTIHRWENERGKGRPSYKKRQTTPEWPWISRVYCQQFFKNRPKQGFFKVIREEAVDERDLEPDI